MGLFDKNLVQKDLSLKDRLQIKILERAEGIKQSIDDASREGVTEFNRMTAIGSYGPEDRSYLWHNRYEAFMDYLNVNLLTMQTEINELYGDSPMIHNGKRVLIDRIDSFSDIYRLLSPDDNINVNVIIRYKLVSGLIHPEEGVMEIKFKISLIKPVQKTPMEWATGIISRFGKPMHII